VVKVIPATSVCFSLSSLPPQKKEFEFVVPAVVSPAFPLFGKLTHSPIYFTNSFPLITQ
jgi:hypothetical protein